MTEIDRVELNLDLWRILGTLPLEEARVVVLHFGIDGRAPCCLDEIAAAVGKKKKLVRQILAKALRKMRHPKRGRALRPYYIERWGWW